MHEATSPPPVGRPRPRLWPAVVLVVVQAVALATRHVVEVGPMAMMYLMMYGPMAATLALVLWWLFASRLPWADRLLGLFVFVLACVAAGFAIDPTVRLYLPMYVIPAATTAAVAWLAVTPRLRWSARRVGLAAVVLAALGFFTLLRSDGVDGGFAAEWRWRWSPTAEDAFLAERGGSAPAPAAVGAEAVTLQPGDWPGFRGPDRDGRLAGVRIATDWAKNPPKQLWKRRVGPGWSSFAVVGHRVVTQEQRGGDEVVVCYHADTGDEVWVHRDATRFTETMAGPGPRATPTFHDGKFYALGANGRLNSLDAATGRVVWARDVVKDSGAEVPTWGFSSSPLVTQGIVTVFAGGPDGKGVLGYRADSGELAWSAETSKISYCSTHLARVGGEEQLLLTTDQGMTAFHPTRGGVLWEHRWPFDGMARVVQPTVLGDGDFLLGTGFGNGTRRLRVGGPSTGGAAEEVWTSRALSPYYNDLVVHKDHMYGFDNNIFVCARVDDGGRRWRGGRYGSGQVLLLADQDLLLVVSEKGDVVLVEANPGKHVEVGRFKAVAGKTWNHPVVAHGRLFVRNGEEMACFDLRP